LINAESTPYLWSLAERGVFCDNSRVCFPSQTRVSSASFITGSYPDKHRIAGNEMYVPEVNPEKAINVGDRAAVLALAELYGGRLFPIPTLGEVLEAAGLKVALVSTASPGSGTIVGTGAGFVWNRAFCLPEDVEERIVERFGPMPAHSDTRALNAYAARVAAEYVLPEVQPDVLLMWLCEPDTALHHCGFGSPEAKEALLHNDTLLRAVHERMGEDAHVFVLSDHGHTPQAPGETIVREAVEAALQRVSGNRVVFAAEGVYFNRTPSPGELELVTRVLQESGEIGPIFSETPLPGVLPLSSVHLSGPHAPHIKFAYAWRRSSSSPDGCGYSFASPRSRLKSSHGSFAVTDMQNMLIAHGPRFGSGVVSSVPCGLIDVAPTVLSLFGIAPPEHWDGRVLWELYAQDQGQATPAPGREGAELVESSEVLTASVRRGRFYYSQEVRLQRIGGTRYLDSARVVHELAAFSR